MGSATRDAPAPDGPGDKQPAALQTPRIMPLPDAQWTDVHRTQVAKYSRTNSADNGFKTLLNVPPIVDGYLSDESTLTPRHRES